MKGAGLEAKVAELKLKVAKAKLICLRRITYLACLPYVFSTLLIITVYIRHIVFDTFISKNNFNFV